MNWSDRTVLITGASSGIGEALAVEFGRRGASVGLLARRAEVLREVAGKVEAAGGRALAVAVDVRDAGEVKLAAAKVVERFGRVDVLVANAGKGEITLARSFNIETATQVLSVNLLGAMNSVAAVLPEMLERGSGQIVGISSLAAYRGFPGSGAYCASKAALSTFFESLRVELRPSNIYVTTIHPGFIDTPMTRGRNRKMPFLLDVEPAARLMLRAIEARRRTYAFPWQLATIARVGRWLPAVLYDRMLARATLRE
ncbi:MAG TPA: SDR family NAD(P)-dependent oxidoreductase [Pyrinomonadaceae bacterium]|nr:SDR family NAD(P)-dependent oxidoreductase [Pyrinomonadaceae bacterium]